MTKVMMKIAWLAALTCGLGGCELLETSAGTDGGLDGGALDAAVGFRPDFGVGRGAGYAVMNRKFSWVGGGGANARHAVTATGGATVRLSNETYTVDARLKP